MNLIFSLRRYSMQTRHYRNARVHTFTIVDTALVMVNDRAGVGRPVVIRCTFAVSFVIGGDVCLR